MLNKIPVSDLTQLFKSEYNDGKDKKGLAETNEKQP